MKLTRLFAAVGVLAALLVPTVASAHPLGNFTVNHYSRIEPAADHVRVVYVLDMAEIPTFQDKPRIDPNPEAYADLRAEELRQNLHLELNGQPAQLRLEQRALSFPDGAGGLPTLRLEAVYTANVSAGAGSSVDLVYRDDNDPTRIGWHEIVARPGAAGTELQHSSVPSSDVTNELRQYPEDLLSSPLNVREARLSFLIPAAAAADPSAAGSPATVGSTAAVGSPAGVGSIAAAGSSAAGSAGSATDLEAAAGVAATRPLVPSTGLAVLDRANTAFADLANGGELTPLFILFALGVAVVLGAAHALQPGHGKTIVAAYLVGSRGTAKHALFLGATVTATHTAGVYLLGIVTLFLSQYIVPERLYPVLEVVSGLLVVVIGVWLFGQRLLAALGLHPGAHDAAHAHAAEHSHAAQHGHATTEHSHAAAHSHADAHAAEPAGTHSHGGGRAHSHTPPSGERVSWKSLLALGVSGGLLPCPEALMVLLITIAAHRLLFGLLLIVAFSTGLAAVLVAFGLLLVYARGFFGRINLSSGLAPRLLPVASALVIVIAGGVITAQALPQVL